MVITYVAVQSGIERRRPVGPVGCTLSSAPADIYQPSSVPGSDPSLSDTDFPVDRLTIAWLDKLYRPLFIRHQRTPFSSSAISSEDLSAGASSQALNCFRMKTFHLTCPHDRFKTVI